METQVIEPHGFCAGVTAALKRALAVSSGGGEVFCLHELVHNEIVVADLARRGFRFVDDVAAVPEGATVLFSAHGVAPSVRAAAAGRGLKVIDATCPFVARVHRAVSEFAARGLRVVVIGNPDHVEVKGIVGEVAAAEVVRDLRDAADLPRRSAGERLGVVSQTTMNSDEVGRIVARLRERFEVETTAEACHATKERQDAVRRFSGDALLVLGSVNSSNTRCLCEVAPCRVFRAGTMDEVRALDLSGVNTLGLTSGASTPETFFSEARRFLERR